MRRRTLRITTPITSSHVGHKERCGQINVHDTKPFQENFDMDARKLPTFKVGQLVYTNEPPCVVLTSATEIVANASYNDLMPLVWSAYETITVRNNTLKILKDDIRNRISIGRAIGVPSLNEIDRDSSNHHKVPKT